MAAQSGGSDEPGLASDYQTSADASEKGAGTAEEGHVERKIDRSGLAAAKGPSESRGVVVGSDSGSSLKIQTIVAG